jgi:hypothetical protein
MKTFIADIIPRIQKYSQKLDNLTLLTNQHWVVVDEIANSKTVYIFRPTKELLISKNGKVEKAKWEYLGNNTLLIDLKDESYLFRHGFFDENILALKIDGREEYAFLVNETKFDRELNSSERILEFLQRKYIEPYQRKQVEAKIGIEIERPKVIVEPVIEKTSETTPVIEGMAKIIEKFITNRGEIEIEHSPQYYPFIGDRAYSDGKPAPDGKYRIGFMWYVHIKNGKVEKTSLF